MWKVSLDQPKSSSQEDKQQDLLCAVRVWFKQPETGENND